MSIPTLYHDTEISSPNYRILPPTRRLQDGARPRVCGVARVDTIVSVSRQDVDCKGFLTNFAKSSGLPLRRYRRPRSTRASSGRSSSTGCACYEGRARRQSTPKIAQVAPRLGCLVRREWDRRETGTPSLSPQNQAQPDSPICGHRGKTRAGSAAFIPAPPHGASCTMRSV